MLTVIRLQAMKWTIGYITEDICVQLSGSCNPSVHGKCVLAFCGRLPDCCWMRQSLQLYFQLLDDIVAVWTDGIF